MIVLFLVAAAMVTGCSNTEKILTKKDGRWEITTSTFELYTNGVLDDSGEWETPQFVTFNDDGTATYEDPNDADFADYTVTWSFNSDNDQMSVNESYEDTNFSLSANYIFDVLESSNNAQSWLSSNTEDSIRLDLRWELSRAD